MRTALILPRHRRPRKPKVPQLYCAEALRACELAAVRVKSAGDELAAHWVALAQKAANGGAIADLLRARAWSRVLESRLKERVAALDQARQIVDEAVLAHGQPWPINELPERAFDQENPTWSLLAKANSVASAKSRPQRHK